MKKRLRLFLSTAPHEHRKFYWFEVNNKDLYWGTSSSIKHTFCEIQKVSNTQFKFITPKHFKTMEESRTKFSYHESGQFHIQKLESGVYGDCKLKEIWKPNEEIVIPLFSILSKPFLNYPIHRKNPTKGGDIARAILLEGEEGKNRILGEFFIIKSVNTNLPKPLLDFGSKYIIHHYPITEDIILCFRFVKLSKLEGWHGDKELIVLRNNRKQELPYSNIS